MVSDQSLDETHQINKEFCGCRGAGARRRRRKRNADEKENPRDTLAFTKKKTGRSPTLLSGKSLVRDKDLLVENMVDGTGARAGYTPSQLNIDLTESPPPPSSLSAKSTERQKTAVSSVTVRKVRRAEIENLDNPVEENERKRAESIEMADLDELAAMRPQSNQSAKSGEIRVERLPRTISSTVPQRSRRLSTGGESVVNLDRATVNTSLKANRSSSHVDKTKKSGRVSVIKLRKVRQMIRPSD